MTPPAWTRAVDLVSARVTPRMALVASFVVMWINFATTSRWAQVPGSVHGPKRWFFVAALAAATIASLSRWTPRRPDRLVAWGAFAVGLGVLLTGIAVWFPVSTWTQIPFLDNWPARFQSTVNAVDLYRQGVAAGWEWHFLGGYHSSSDITVTLTALAALPMWVAGPELGFHLLHFALLLALPALIWIDLRPEPGGDDVAPLAAGLVSLSVAGWFSYYLLRSGDTNSLAGTVCVVAALTGSHAAASGRRWGALLLVVSMAVVNYSHAGFFVYGSVLLGLEAVFYRDWRRARASAIAIGAGFVAALPLTWETFRYPEYFFLNQVVGAPPFDWATFLRRVYYNVEMLVLPARWFNDFASLALVLGPVLLFAAFAGGRPGPGHARFARTRFHAWAALAALALLRLNTPEFGYAFLRPVHLLSVYPTAALAGFLVTFVGARRVLASTTLVVALYLQFLWVPVPHVPDARALDPGLVDRLRGLDGAMILLENTFHRDMDVDPARESERTPFAAHLEGLLVPATGKRFYAGVWDGWQWSPARTNLLSGGALQGRPIADVPWETFVGELRRWGIRHVVAWSPPTLAYLRAHQPAVAERWQNGRWVGFELASADTRDVVTATGRGRLERLSPLGAEVHLDNVRRGDDVVIRTNYFPAWSARQGGVGVDLLDAGGQLAFRAPADGSYVVSLEYPRRLALTWLAVLTLVAAVVVSVWSVGSVPARVR